MDDTSLQLLNEVSQWQQPVAIGLWVLFVFVGLLACAYAIIQGDKIVLEPTGRIETRTLMETFGKVHNSYPLILAFSVGALIVLILAAIIAFSIRGTPLSIQLSENFSEDAIEALVTAIVTAFYSILTGYLLTTTRGAKSFTELFRGKDLAALIAGALIGIQLAYSLAVLFFQPY